MDYMIRGTLEKYPVRFSIGRTTDTVEKMNRIHNTTPTAAAAAGRALTAVALMSFMLKNDNDKISAVISGDGEIGRIIATSGIDAKVKCDILNPGIQLMINDKGKLDVARAVGKGSLTVIRDMGLKEPHVGHIELVSSEIGEDFTYYFAVSEQIPSIVSLGVLVSADYKVEQAGGFIVQVMPDCEEEIIAYLEEKAGSIKPVTSLLSAGLDCEGIAKEMFGEYKFKVTEIKKVEYYCDCSKERIEKALIAMGKSELEALIEDQGNAEIKCHFCNKLYEFSRDELERLRESM